MSSGFQFFQFLQFRKKNRTNKSKFFFFFVGKSSSSDFYKDYFRLLSFFLRFLCLHSCCQQLLLQNIHKKCLHVGRPFLLQIKSLSCTYRLPIWLNSSFSLWQYMPSLIMCSCSNRLINRGTNCWYREAKSFFKLSEDGCSLFVSFFRYILV